MNITTTSDLVSLQYIKTKYRVQYLNQASLFHSVSRMWQIDVDTIRTHIAAFTDGLVDDRHMRIDEDGLR